LDEEDRALVQQILTLQSDSHVLDGRLRQMEGFDPPRRSAILSEAYRLAPAELRERLSESIAKIEDPASIPVLVDRLEARVAKGSPEATTVARGLLRILGAAGTMDHRPEAPAIIASRICAILSRTHVQS